MWCRVLAVSPALRHSEGASNRPSEQPGEADTESRGSCQQDSSKRNWEKIPVKRHFGSDHLPVVLEASGHLAMDAAHHRHRGRLVGAMDSAHSSKGEDATVVIARGIVRWLSSLPAPV